MGEGSNGAIEDLKEWQLGHFGELSRVLQDGFHALEVKLDILTDTVDKQLTSMVATIVDSSLGKNTIQIEMAREMLERQQTTYTEALANERKNNKWTIRVLCWTFGSVLTAVIGLRVALPHWFGS